MDEVAREISGIVVEACHAQAVAIWLDGAVHGIGISASDARRDGDTLSKRLSDFLRSRCAGDGERKLSGIEPYVSDTEDDAVFLLLPLQVGRQVFGAVAMAIPLDQWGNKQVFDTCSKVASLAAIILSTSSSRFQLEVDLAEMSLRAQRLARSAEIDALTKVENRASFETKVKARLNQRSRPAALLAIDLDDFKQVNDIYGHRFGDQFLTTIAEAMKVSFPKTTIIGRTGGDEFCVLVDTPEAGRSYLNSLIRQARAAVQRSMAVLGKADLGRMSIGVCLFPTQAQTYEQLHARADIALYSAKRTERNTTRIFGPDLESMAAATDPRPGDSPFEGNRIRAHFQPIVNFSTGVCEGLELLARWKEDGQPISGPNKFGWIFRDHRFASKLTTHIVETALAALENNGWGGIHAMPDLWINVTDHDLLTPEFVFELQSVLTSYGVAWDKIVIEVNEAIMLGERNGQVFHSLQEMRRRGARVALDDFGTGYAGLTHVSRWPVDIIKIDRSFIEGIETDKGAHVVVEALVMIANTMSQHIVAEGIETPTQLAAMRKLGCGFGQGFLLSEPMSGEDLAECSRTFDLDQLECFST